MGSNLGSARIDPSLTRHFDGFSLEELETSVEAMRSLRAHPGWLLLSSVLDAEVALIDRDLDGRVLDTRADYASKHGRRGGLRAPELLIEALISRAESRLREQRIKHEGAAEPALGGIA